MAITALPGSRGFLYTGCNGNCAIGSGIYVFDLAADSARRVVANAAGAWYSPTGHLLYTDRTGGLFAMGFDASRLVPTSGAVPVMDDVLPGGFALSASGMALYAASNGGKALAELMWVSRDGAAVPLDSTWRGDFNYPALSPRRRRRRSQRRRRHHTAVDPPLRRHPAEAHPGWTRELAAGLDSRRPIARILVATKD
jgi:hypothetical protein